MANPPPAPNPRALVAYPFLFIIGVFLAKLLTQAEELPPADALWPGFLVLTAALLVLGLFRLLMRDWHKAGLSLLILLTLSGTNPTVERLVSACSPSWLQPDQAAWMMVVPSLVSLGIFGFLFVYVLRMQRALVGLTQALNWGSGFGVLFLLGRTAYHEYTIDTEAVHMPVPTAGRAAASPPNIFYIVLDRYPRADLLRDEFGYDNQDFLNYLRGRGFYVADQSHCCYANSLLSYWSTMNMGFLPDVISAAQVSRSTRRSHRVGEFLKGQGYRYLHLGNWYSPTSRCGIADENRISPASLGQLDLACLHGTSEWLYQWAYQVNHGRQIRYQLEEIAACAGEAGPLFLMAHVLLPHDPFVFTADGEFHVHVPLNMHESLFVEQLRYTNARLRELIDHILAQSARPPVIILQGDEGPYPSDSNMPATVQGRLRYRTAILNAYYLPGVDPAALRPTLSPANSFRVVFNHYFGTGMDLLPDKTFAWGDPPLEFHKRKTYQFREADQRMPP